MQHPNLSVVVIPLFLFATKLAVAGDDEPRIVVGEVNPWTHLNLANDPESFQFAIVTDKPAAIDQARSQMPSASSTSCSRSLS